MQRNGYMFAHKLAGALIVLMGAVLGIAAFIYTESRQATYISSLILRIPAELRSDLVLPMYRTASEESSKANLLLSGNAILLTYEGLDPGVASAELMDIKSNILGSGQQVAERNLEAIEGQKIRVDQAITDLSENGPGTDTSSIVVLMTLTNQLAQQRMEIANFDRWIIEQESAKVETRKSGLSSLTFSTLLCFAFVIIGFLSLYVYARRSERLKVEVPRT